ncbi:hypothetical protein C8Q74DRAFT_1294543 [Fomes fomentarius]|nr:hypothetical protein C8Q74DRAFT_1294543 [Fomes fomentarius]
MHYRALSDLPTELIHIIVSQLENKLYVQACSLTSLRIRAVAVEFMFGRQLQVRIGEPGLLYHLVRFLTHNPRVAQHIITLSLHVVPRYRTTELNHADSPVVDETAVARMMQAVGPNVKTLTLSGFTFLCFPPITLGTNEGTTLPAAGPYTLQELAMYNMRSPSTLSGLFNVLSLFIVVFLDLGDRSYSFDTTRPLDIGCVRRHLRIEKLRTYGCYEQLL